MSVKINKNYITFFTQKINRIASLKVSGTSNPLSEVCWYAVDENPPFTHDLIDVNICTFNNFEFIDLLKKIISKCFEIYKDKFKTQNFFLWESVEPNFIFKYNLFRSLLLEYLLAYNFAYVLLREYYSDSSKTEEKKEELENIKNAKLSKNDRIIFDFNNFTFPEDIIITKRISKKTKRKSSTASRRSFNASRTARNIYNLRRTSFTNQIILPEQIENLIAAGSTSPSSDYDVTLDFEYIEGLKINLIINYAFQKFMVEKNDEYHFNYNKSLGKLFDSNIYSHKTSVSSNHYEKLEPYFLPLEGKSFLLPKKFIETEFIMEELKNCLNNDIDKGKTEDAILKDLLIYEVDLNSTYNKIAKYNFNLKSVEPITLYKNLVSYLHLCLKHAVEVYEGISTIYHVVYALQLKDKEAINYFKTDDYSYRVAFVSAVDNLVHLFHLMNDKDYVVEGRPIINSKNVKYVARILHAYNLCEMGLNKKRTTLSKRGVALTKSVLSQKRRSIRTIKQTKKLQRVNEEGTPTKENTRKFTIKTDTFYDLGSYNFLMKIKNGETIKLEDFNYPEFNAIKIFILSQKDYNSKGTDISYLIRDDFETFYNDIGYSISIQENKTLNTRGTKKLLDFKKEFYSKKIFLEFIKYKIIKLLEKLPRDNNIDKIKTLKISQLKT